MIHKAWCSKEEVPYNFSRSYIKFQGHTGWKIDDLDQIWARLLGRSQLSNPSDLPCSRSYIKLQAHTALKIVNFDPNWAFPDCHFSLSSPMSMKWYTNWGFQSYLGKITRPVVAIKSLRFALLFDGLSLIDNWFHVEKWHENFYTYGVLATPCFLESGLEDADNVEN